jgi:foldase protein PrsA
MKKYLLMLLVLSVSVAGKVYSQNVAEIGKDKITLDEFKSAYLEILKQPKYFDSKKKREEFLDELILTRVMGKEACRLKYDKREIIKYRMNAYKDKCLRDAHFEKLFRPQIKTEDKDIEEAYQFTQEQRRISHLFAETKAMADSLYEMLQKGTVFEDLAKTVFIDTAMAKNGGDLGWVYWDQLDYNLGQAAFRTPLHQYSKPVKSPYGWHIIKVTGFKKNPLISRAEYEIHKRKAKALLEYKIGDQLANDYLEKMAKNAKIEVYSSVLGFVHEKIADKFKRKPRQTDAAAEVQLQEKEIHYVEMNLWDARNEVMAKINGKPYTVGQFMSALSYIPYEAIYQGFKSTLDVAFRNMVIDQEAESMGLESDEKVKMKTNLYNEFETQIEYRRELVGSVKVSENEMKKHYEENKPKYKGCSFDQMHDIIQNYLMLHKQQTIVPNKFNSLTKNIKVIKHCDVINNYYDGVYKDLPK